MTSSLALGLSALAAIVPTVIYSFAFYWADRYEREPRALILTAFFWGALPAVIVSLVSELAIGSPFVAEEAGLQTALVSTVLVAPIVEELAKGAALIGLFLWKRNEFDGVLDGLIYGALVGFGFAMTENFLYFLGAYDAGGFAALTWLIFVRAIVFGLNHAFYTSLTGIGLGMARNVRSTALRLVWIGFGLGAAIAVHAAHNLGAVLSGLNPLGFLLSLVIAAGGASLVVVAVLLSWNHERAVIRSELAEELGNLLTADELLQLTGRWRQPIRRSRDQTADLMALYVELAVRKRRIRRLGATRTADAMEEIEQIRIQVKQIKGTTVDSADAPASGENA